MTENQPLIKFKCHLSLIKAMPTQKRDDQFYKLMTQARDKLDPLSMDMAQFYYEYADFILQKMERNVDMFNPNSLPQEEIAENLALSDEQAEQNQENQMAPSVEQSGAQENCTLAQGGATKQQGGKPVIPQEADIIPKNNSQQKKNASNDSNSVNENEVANNDNNDNNEYGEDDEICYENLQCALKIYLSEKQLIIKKGENPSKFLEEEINEMIRKTRTRLGDLYIISEKYTQAIAEFRNVIGMEMLKPGHEGNRGLAEFHYLIGTSFLYDSKNQCEIKAIAEFITAVEILINHTNQKGGSCITFPLPTEIAPKVDRIKYLPKADDSEYVIEMKNVISCLLDRIEDTHDQIAVKEQVQIEREKTKKFEETQINGFHPAPQGATIVNLGIMGNRKKLPNSENKSNGDNQESYKQPKKPQPNIQDKPINE